MLSAVDTKTMNLDLGDDSHHVKAVLSHAAEMAVNMEAILQNMNEWKTELQAAMQQQRTHFDSELAQIRTATTELKEFMTEAGAARMRSEMQKTLQMGEEHVAQLQILSDKYLTVLDSTQEDIKNSFEQTNKDIRGVAMKSYDRFNRMSTYTIKNISEAVSSFRISDFQKLTEQSVEKVAQTSFGAISRVGELVKWFHWKNLILAFFLSMVVVVTMCLYMNAEWPWENHQESTLQRSAGKALISAWPHLTKAEQEHIIDHSKTSVV